jgi:hypothetical protein
MDSITRREAVKKQYALVPVILLAFACGRAPHAPAEGTKIAVVEFSVAPNATIEDYRGDVASLGMPIAEAIAEEIRDAPGSTSEFTSAAWSANTPISPRAALDAQAIGKTVPPEGDLIVRGEITHVYGGNLAVRLTVLVCTFCGWWKGYAVVGVQGQVVRRDGTVVGVFSDEKVADAGGEASSVAAAAKRAGAGVGEMVREGEYHGGHPGNDGYLAPVKVAEPSAERPPAERLRALDSLRAQGLISDAEYAEKRKQILQDF